MGRESIVPHDERYDMADEYLSVLYKLWEASWEEGAVLADCALPQFADPAKVHVVRHQGKYFRLEAMHPCLPSPQRTPLLMQAGASGRGKQFAAENAECVFVNGVSHAQVAANVADIRNRARKQGRNPDNILVLAGATIIVGRTEAEAREKMQEYRSYAIPEAVLAHASGGLGIDLSKYPLDEPLCYEETDANRTSMEIFTKSKERRYTPRQIAEEMALSARNLLIAGSVEQVVAELSDWMEKTGIDGFNIARLIMPETLEDFIDLVVPVLQERRLYKTEYRSGTLREKLFSGAGPTLEAPHPAALARRVA